jgi:transcriptional antiterminator
MQIVGQLLGKSRAIYTEDVYECMIDLNDAGKKITWSKIAQLLDCSVRTVLRNINKELKQEKKLLNEKIQY